jgi:hypothetical protein
MYIAYSALQQQPNAGREFTETDETESQNLNFSLRYNAYQSICNKYHREIAAIQKYLPGWQPAPPVV